MIPLVPIIFFFIILISTGHSDDLSLKKSLTFYASFDNGTNAEIAKGDKQLYTCLLYTSPSPRDVEESRMPSSA